MLVEIRHRHALKLAKHHFAHVDDHALTDIRDEIRLTEVENAAEEKHDDDADCNQIEQRHVFFGEHLVDHVFDDPRDVEVCRRREDDADDCDAEAFQVRFDVNQQTLVIFHETLPIALMMSRAVR